jgi:hypothetical protein
MYVRRLRAALTRLVGLVGRDERDRELAEELEIHLQMQIDDSLRAGMSQNEARRRALVKLGGLTQTKEECRRRRGFPVLEDLWQDLRYGVRILAKQPGFTAVAALALALGIGVNTAILSTVNGFVLRPLPVEKPTELVAPYWGKKMDAEVWGEFSYPNYLDLREQNKSFSDLCAWDETSAGISSGESRNDGDSEHAEVVWGELISANYFDVMGVKPMLGRGFLPEEDRTPNTHPVAVISHSLWQRRFDADAGVVGKTIYLNYQHTYAAMTVLISAESAGALQTVAESARREIAQLDARLPVYGVMMAEENMTIAYWGPRLAAGAASTFGVLALVLATMGVYSVMTYAVSQRTREIGIRMALGAQVRDVLRLVVSQGMRMALIGIVLGLVGAFALTRVLSSLLFGVGATDSITYVGVPVLLIAVALLACYIPARRAARVDPLLALRHE